MRVKLLKKVRRYYQIHEIENETQLNDLVWVEIKKYPIYQLTSPGSRVYFNTLNDARDDLLMRVRLKYGDKTINKPKRLV